VTDLDKISGVKRFLRRTKTTQEIEALSATTFSAATEEVVITLLSADGTSSSGQVSFPKWLLLQICEEILAESGGRKLMSFPDMRVVHSVT
jgi:hypothetical protein